jgi:PncC family amidohydrolase
MKIISNHDALVSEISTLLVAKKAMVSTAESCTGGLLGAQLTSISGSSHFYTGGVVTYANQTKIDMLKIPPQLIETHGAVSKQVCEYMANSCRQLFKTNYALSITGIAGPGGGTPQKPVGTVWIGFSSDSQTHSIMLSLKGSRFEIRSKAVEQTLLNFKQFVQS